MENYYSCKSVAAVLLDGIKYEMYKMFETHRERERERERERCVVV